MVKMVKSVVSPDTLAENMKHIHDFLRGAYTEAKEQLQERMSFLKDEFTGIQEKAGRYVNRMLLPVNNFLKDFREIDHELLAEFSRDPDQFIFLEGKLLHMNDALRLQLEENY